ncbi:MAG TPA: c-type cytochrome [Terriglobales bacterium]|nr:c-type cytochrome [Terriglobales bacterium]
MRPLLLLGLAALSLAAQAPRTPPGPPKNLLVLPPTLTHAQLLRRMRSLDIGLGVKCSFCHVKADDASDALDSKLVSRRMLRMVDAINRDNFSGRPEVTCYTCHRGHRRPLRQPPIPAGAGR